uniref:Histone chaperone n=1 Tax=Aureoumbra lagunensis TaxID=44058 RepID=A0A7S3JUA3_9STRA|mmetsp:Transcript_7739/g.10779  ORF Transcript_7739/g.10779 Transcript_7739/m.10779 type:complete len:256 (+) Transcript_7739:65-832(+)|eukprot:CAMPEP_0197299260 /NCGR_PEP_ID=MMETSP0890-20130614/45610_1 /TAXON_ID=44058 ORGANISM="Aureoumbra lagunensis, Strain CCMP1510" /NCGR_SAMPLE_ID=MMETSP0890 /ASSEMBLY_ACC=CAM_ASM_000533 /LENGTH=255 /DNA_ID=CAMNT_0042777481 /DNA_START=56 /DNA_END=823 /DNA_ORIENTATION=+
MAPIEVESIRVVSCNPARFIEAYQFEITFECIEELEDDLEWSVIYVGSASDESKDQKLEEVSVGPVPIGTSKFVLEAPAPNWEMIPEIDRLGVTVLNVSCSYKGQVFVNIGYYINNEYYSHATPDVGGEPLLDSSEAPKDDVSRVWRNMCIDEPRITTYSIKWGLATDIPEIPEENKEFPPAGDQVHTCENEVDQVDLPEENEDSIADDDSEDVDDEEDDREEEDDASEIDLGAEEDHDASPVPKRQRTSIENCV